MKLFDNQQLASTFVGRDREIHALDQHFSRGGRIAVIRGERGSGKTALAYMFGQWAESTDLFPGGWQRINISPYIRDEDVLPTPPKDRTLLVVDDFDFAKSEIRQQVTKLLERHQALSAIICTNDLIQSDLASVLQIQLGGLSQEEFRELIEHRVALAGKDRKLADQLFQIVAGSPLYADLAGRTIRELMLSLNEFMHGLGEFWHSGILGPDGQPIQDVPQPIQIAVIDTNTALVERLRLEPELLRDLTPRRFEEIVAELLSQQGYSVELTPPSQDGGFDMYAARKDGLGRFLFLVECKRYTPPNKVGVSIVRSLHGVVQQQQANAGIVVTSSFFTRGAKEFQQRIPYQVQLQDYLAIQQWLDILKKNG